MLILSFLHRAHGMSFYSENLHECEDLVYIWLQFFPEFFTKFCYFLNFSKCAGAGELGHHSSAFTIPPACFINCVPLSDGLLAAAASALHPLESSSQYILKQCWCGCLLKRWKKLVCCKREDDPLSCMSYSLLALHIIYVFHTILSKRVYIEGFFF